MICKIGFDDNKNIEFGLTLFSFCCKQMSCIFNLYNFRIFILPNIIFYLHTRNMFANNSKDKGLDIHDCVKSFSFNTRVRLCFYILHANRMKVIKNELQNTSFRLLPLHLFIFEIVLRSLFQYTH